MCQSCFVVVVFLGIVVCVAVVVVTVNCIVVGFVICVIIIGLRNQPSLSDQS